MMERYLQRAPEHDRPALVMQSGSRLSQLVGFHLPDGTEVQYSRKYAIELGLVAEAMVPLCSMPVESWVIINNKRFLNKKPT
jgi:hypothetical protein